MKTFKKFTVLLALVAFVSCGAFNMAHAAKKEGGGAKPEKVEADKLPAAVKTALDKECGGATAMYSKMEKDGKAVYTARWKDGDKTYMAAASEDGTITKPKAEAKPPAKKEKKPE